MLQSTYVKKKCFKLDERYNKGRIPKIIVLVRCTYYLFVIVSFRHRISRYYRIIKLILLVCNYSYNMCQNKNYLIIHQATCVLYFIYSTWWLLKNNYKYSLSALCYIQNGESSTFRYITMCPYEHFFNKYYYRCPWLGMVSVQHILRVYLIVVVINDIIHDNRSQTMCFSKKVNSVLIFLISIPIIFPSCIAGH